MNAETFLEQFDTFAAAPNGVDQLRAMILQLAVQGKLVPQDPDDEPASELFTRIKAEWTRLSEGKRASRQELIEPVDESMGASNVPAGWQIVPFGNVVQIVRGVTFPSSAKGKTKTPRTVACLRTTNVQDTVEWDDLLYVPPDVVGRDDQWVQPMDILISMANSYALVGKVALITEPHPETTFGGFLAAIRPIQIEPRFVLQVLRSPDFQAAFRSSSSQTTNIANISLAGIRPLPFPLPPLAEQKRIVAKVDQLLALCDELAARQAARRVARAQLVGATLDRLVSTSWDRLPACQSDTAPRSAGSRAVPPTRQAGSRSHAPHVDRLRTHFDHLFDTPTTIPQLRQTILQLAVQGQLVPQEPKDEPIENAVQRISESRTQFENSGRLRGDLSHIEPDEEPFIQPSNWRWIRFGELANIVGGVTLGRKLESRKLGLFPYLRVANVQQGRHALGVIKEIEVPIDELPKYRLQPGDVLLTEGGDWDKLGRSAIWRGEIENCLHQNHIFRARAFNSDVESEWLTLFTNSPVGRTYFQNAAKKTTNLASINMRQLRHCPIPVPPLAEQKRIVAKVTELLSLCDALEAQLKTAESASTQLLSAAVHCLLGGAEEGRVT